MNTVILINLLQLSHKSPTGSFVYAENILSALLEIDKENHYILLLRAGDYDLFKNKFKNKIKVSFRVIDIRRDVYVNPARAFLKIIYKYTGNIFGTESIIKEEIQKIIKKDNVGIYFSPSGTIYPRGLSGVKFVTTIFDIQHEYMPQNFGEQYLNSRKKDCGYAIANSHHLLAISNFTKNSVLKYYNIDQQKITTVYLAAQNIRAGEHGSNLPSNFIFYPSAIWPHKNHKILIEAVNLIKERFPDLNLVFSGVVKNKSLMDELVNLVAHYGLSGEVHFWGYVSEDVLGCLYKKAKILVFPSSFEGFGIPLVEAFKYGVPVVAADNTSIAEIVDGAGLLVPTGDEKALAEAISRVLSDDNLRNELIQKGYERAKMFSWEKSALQTLGVFKSLLN